MNVTLTQLLGGRRAAGDISITGMTADSRLVTPGCLFVALPGARLDGRTFIRAAVEKGAGAILTTPGGAPADISVPVVEDRNPRRRYAELAARFYDRQPAIQVAVTGTNGKTSVAEFTRQVWTHLGHKAASVGTLGVHSDVFHLPAGLTTPDPLTLHHALHTLAEGGVDHCAFEASSHGLDQYRLDGVHLKAGAFTNLTRDHMDYHKTEQGYFFAKARLFGDLIAPGDAAVINIDDPWGRILEDIVWARGIHCLSIGMQEKAAMRITGFTPLPTGQRISVQFEDRTHVIELPLVGAFQAKNALTAAGLAIATGSDTEKTMAVLPHLQGVPGRMELVGVSARGGAVFVDFAHTPDGLKTVLEAARAHEPNSLSVVFGCGGDRDSGKRPIMGAIAAALADRAIVTDDNPRTEAAAPIRAAIMAACPDAREIADRLSAIEAAIAELQDGDMLVIAGKGHEQGQIVGDTILPFSDVETVRGILASGG